jgi:hypothetical protein
MASVNRPGGLVLAAILTAACDGQPTRPTTQPTPTPPAGERWNLTATLRSITGPEACISVAARTTIGQSFSWLLTTDRSGNSVHLTVSDPDDPALRDEYEGAVVEDVLTAANRRRVGTTLCGGSRVEVVADSHVSGRFAGDGRVLTAEEVRSFQLSSGETVRSYYEWNARQ